MFNPEDSDIRKHFLDPPLLLQSTLDMLQPEIMFIDTDFHIIYMNRSKRDYFPHVGTGERCYEVFEDYGKRCPHCVAHHAMNKGMVQENPFYTSIGPKGEVRHLNITASPIIDEEGEILGAIEVVYDITVLYQSNAQLEALNKEYESVIYALSHDLRSPLVSIEGFVRKLAKKHIDMDDEKAAHCINRIRANVRMMNDFVTVLLDTSRISTGKLDIIPTNLKEVVKDVMGQFETRAAEQGAKLTTAGDFDTVECDRVRIIQVFSNLVGNALSHCNGVENLEIEIGARNGVFWVRDNGPGISPEFKEKLFEPFSQANKNEDQHFGMGMNIVSKILQKHGGDIWVESDPGKGTCLYFTLTGRSKQHSLSGIENKKSK